jgi:hypothetical protein
MPAFGGMTIGTYPLSWPLLSLKQTSLVAVHMPVNDPKRTGVASVQLDFATTRFTSERRQVCRLPPYIFRLWSLDAARNTSKISGSGAF